MATKFPFLHSFIFLIIVATVAATVNAIREQTLDVGALTSSTYLTRLRTIRSKLGVTYSKHVPVLPVFTKTNNPPMFDVVLKTSKHQISVKVREDNLYTVGYKMQNPPVWLEFENRLTYGYYFGTSYARGFKSSTGTHLIDGSKFLELGESYIALANAAETNATVMSFAKFDFIRAVNELAVTTNTTIRAKWMILVITMISESTRFADISNLLANNLNSPSSKLKPYMAQILVKNWEKYSTMVLRTEADPCYKFVPPIIEGSRGDTVEQLRNRFGLMYRDPITLKKPCTLTAALNDMMPMMELVAQA